MQGLGVESRHAVIEQQQGDTGHILHDLRSAAGTTLNGSLLPGGSSSQLRSGDALRFGQDPTVYLFHADDGAQHHLSTTMYSLHDIGAGSAPASPAYTNYRSRTASTTLPQIGLAGRESRLDTIVSSASPMSETRR